jgi:acyl-CoA thioester hydrolase
MIESRSKLIVRYSETDQMGFVYYGNYAQYLEVGRVDALKTVGLSYRSMEKEGYALPVRELKINYHNAALYDDELEVITRVKQMPSNKIVFDYEIRRKDALIVTAQTTLFFIDVNKRACRPPKYFVEKMELYFS